MALSINKNYLSENFLKSWSDGSTNNVSLFPEDAIVTSVPFRCFALPNFVDFSSNKSDTEDSSSSCEPKHKKAYLDLLREELELLELHEKKNDLYNFRQSDDLHNMQLPAINAFRELFNVQVKEWLEQLTGIPLDVRVAMTASAYACSDHLLCHDDELENRRIAFAFYLTPNWTASDGGCLDLFSSDEKVRPLEIVRSIHPRENMLSFFEVVPRSFHQVSEVLNPHKIRWSINGWFHGAAIERPLPVAETEPKQMQPCFVEFDDLLAWINPDYIDPQTQAGIREQFGDKSEIQLHDFLQAERYEAVIGELEGAELKWERRGPWNRRNYLSLDVGLLDAGRYPNLSFCLRLMHSEAMCLLLSQFTDVRVHPLYTADEKADSGDNDVEYKPPEKKVKSDNGDTNGNNSAINGSEEKVASELSPCEMELRKFTPGSYTLLSDADFARGNNETFGLDAQLCFTPYSWDTEHGGFTCYVEADSGEELLTVTPRGNSLVLVFRESGTHRFVKYISQNTSQDSTSAEAMRYFSDIFAVYHEAAASKDAFSGSGE